VAAIGSESGRQAPEFLISAHDSFAPIADLRVVANTRRFDRDRTRNIRSQPLWACANSDLPAVYSARDVASAASLSLRA
jgi:hypothetical protein